MRDIITGGDAIKKHARKYYPQGSIDNDDYNARIQRSEFFPATSRTAEGVHGLAFSKDVSVNVKEELKTYLENVDGKGHSLYKFINDATWEEMITNHTGFLVDAPNLEGQSVKSAEDNKLQSYVVMYKAEQILDIHTDIIGREEVITMVRLKELVQTPVIDDKYTEEIKEQYRVLELDEKGFYKQTLFDRDNQILEEVYPKKFGEQMRYIPFFIKDVDPLKPIFKDLADVNISHWLLSVDHRNGLHWIGAPTPYVSGYQPETITRQLPDGTFEEEAVDTLKLGCNTIAYLPQGATMAYMELSGSGFENIVSEMERDEERMAILGARIISHEKKGVESAETARIHRAGENSVVATFCNECSHTFTLLFKEYLEWCSGSEVDDDFKISINTDFDNTTMSPAELATLISAWQSGAIPKRVLFDSMKKGEVVDSTESFEDMQDEIRAERETEPPIIPPVNAGTENE